MIHSPFTGAVAVNEPDDQPAGRGWLRVAAVRIAVSLRRGDRTVARDDNAVAAGGIDPELALIPAR